MNYINIISKPIIGALIGYSTNYIAVRMMFRPLKEVKLGRFTLPFTPGIIPKNKPRIAKAIATSISNDLLNQDDLKSALLSNEIKENLSIQINQIISENIIDNGNTIYSTLNEIFDEEKLESFIQTLEELLSKKIYSALCKSNIGNLVSIQIEKAAREKISGSLLGMIGGNAIVESISKVANEKVNSYIENESIDFIKPLVKVEIRSTFDTSVSTAAAMLNIDSKAIEEIFFSLYEKIIINKFDTIFKTINIERIIENKINSMDSLELEKLILSIMKKELNALINLGAIIGFILGLLNLVI